MASAVTLSADTHPSLTLRHAFTYAALPFSSAPVRLTNIRDGKNRSGLQARDVAFVRLLYRLSGEEVYVDGLRVGSEEATWFGDVTLQEGGSDASSSGEESSSTAPTIYTRHLNASPSPCTSLPTLLHGLLPALIHFRSPTTLNFTSGSITHLLHFKHILIPFLCTHFDIPTPALRVSRHSTPPLGRAQLSFTFFPPPSSHHLSPITLLDRGDVTQIHAHLLLTGKLPKHTLTRATDALGEVLKTFPAYAAIPVTIYTTRDTAAGGGDLEILVWAETSTGCRLSGSARGRGASCAEQVGGEAARALIGQLAGGGCVDEWMQVSLALLFLLSHFRRAESYRESRINSSPSSCLPIPPTRSPAQPQSRTYQHHPQSFSVPSPRVRTKLSSSAQSSPARDSTSNSSVKSAIKRMEEGAFSESGVAHGCR